PASAATACPSGTARRRRSAAFRSRTRRRARSSTGCLTTNGRRNTRRRRRRSRRRNSHSRIRVTERRPVFAGFEQRRIAAADAEIAVRLGGSGPPLLLLHGYPQTSAIWHAIAPRLAERFALVMPDLPGYGASTKPPSGPDHVRYSKRAM